MAMKLGLFVALLAVGCGSKTESSGTGSAAPAARISVTDPLGFCGRASAVLTRRRTCFPEDTSIKMALDQIAELEGDAPADPVKRRSRAAECAVTLDGLMRAEQPKNCPLDVLDTERTELATFLAAWYGERTAAPTTGNAAADAGLVKLAAQRDAACACKNLACLRAAAIDLDKIVPSSAPPEGLAASAKMIDEVGRCKQRLVYGPPQ